MAFHWICTRRAFLNNWQAGISRWTGLTSSIWVVLAWRTLFRFFVRFDTLSAPRTLWALSCSFFVAEILRRFARLRIYTSIWTCVTNWADNALSRSKRGIPESSLWGIGSSFTRRRLERKLATVVAWRALNTGYFSRGRVHSRLTFGKLLSFQTLVACWTEWRGYANWEAEEKNWSKRRWSHEKFRIIILIEIAPILSDLICNLSSLN